MKRREFMALLGGAAATWPLAARAQQSAMPVVGFLSSYSSSDAFAQRLLAAFHQGLKQAGYVENQNVAIEYRWAGSEYERLTALATELARRPVNVIATGKRYRSHGDGIHTWTESEVARFEERHPIGTKSRLALALLLYTAQRRSDVVCFGWQHITGDAIALRQEKTNAPQLIPIHPELAKTLAAVPRTNMTFLVTERGKPFTRAGFGNWFRDRCNEAGLPQCSAHGLRKAAATRLANAGCSTDQIKAITGHKALSEVARYTKAADQQRLARRALSIQLGAEQERNLSNLPTRLDKMRSK